MNSPCTISITRIVKLGAKSLTAEAMKGLDGSRVSTDTSIRISRFKRTVYTNKIWNGLKTCAYTSVISIVKEMWALSATTFLNSCEDKTTNQSCLSHYM
jgi:hypothetical protein